MTAVTRLNGMRSSRDASSRENELYGEDARVDLLISTSFVQVLVFVSCRVVPGCMVGERKRKMDGETRVQPLSPFSLLSVLGLSACGGRQS